MMTDLIYFDNYVEQRDIKLKKKYFKWKLKKMT